MKNERTKERTKEIIGTVANGKVGPGLHLQRWWSKESTVNRRKMVSEEIHRLEEVRRFATAVGQRKQGAWTKWENAKDRAEALKICCETAIKALNIINKRAIHFVKERNISKLARKNMR